ncbi:hypothetical protein K493DRAFT_350827 [Basidiobolus meristosporus CBS 931.73]|uniref:Ras GTPase-activating-like protein IQGAP1 n=1 Tax=Basidiobolus meristosporus CBS 931.73 TaxID=1314790 RepID=A0A1Y1YEG4_9FUNG|nr:hypothetical protein K493DRAFT_350827 [Basidiobolus meristosporus CBS 931.73]|eukprot:ORX96397.1 hypothetical protein K493DRAFT_350827 [Basidiobolus meristosporus CBS 931.73]
MERRNLQVYEYLCHIGEAKEWIETCIKEEIPPIDKIEEGLRNGIIIAKLAQAYEPDCVKRIFDDPKLQYRHSDNINFFFAAIKKIGLPENFYFELTDLYEKKNLPKVIYCIHALGHLLFQQSRGPSINDLIGKLNFSEEQLQTAKKELERTGVSMPAFKNVEIALTQELQKLEPQQAVKEEKATYWKTRELSVQKCQAIARGYLARRSYKVHRATYHENTQLTIKIQSQARGVIARKLLYNKLNSIKTAEPSIVKLQNLARGYLARKRQNERKEHYKVHQREVTQAQAVVRGYLTRHHIRQEDAYYEQNEHKIVLAQAVVRGYLTRNHIKQDQCYYEERKAEVVHAQALTRGFLVRKQLEKQQAHYKIHEDKVVKVQALVRGVLSRQKVREVLEHYHMEEDKVVQIQALIRGNLARKRMAALRDDPEFVAQQMLRLPALDRNMISHQNSQDVLEHYANHEEMMHQGQAFAKGYLLEQMKQQELQHYQEHEEHIVEEQALTKGFITKYLKPEKVQHYSANIDKVIKVQSIFRAKMAKKAYHELTSEENPPVTTMRNFLHLVDDSEKDFQEEMDLEVLRQRAVLTIRENNELESLLNDLDIKIALLVKNRISLEEVIKVSRRQYKVVDDYQSAHAASSLKSLDKDSRHRLECYQHLFYLLQTQPVYLARLLFVMNQNMMGDHAKKFVETVVLTLFGFAQNEREEYLLLKLFKAAIEVEISNVANVQDFLRGNPVFIKLAVHYNRGAKERKYLRELLQPLVKQIIEDPTMDLETDPVSIYRKLIREEESRTGQRSERPYDVSLDTALDDLDTRNTLVSHLKQLTSITTRFVNEIHSSLDRMPYGIRYIARELRDALMQKLPQEQENNVLKVVGHLVYYRYINPAIIAPDSFDVIETPINPMQRKNLAEIAKMLNQVSVGKPFSNENIGLKPLDSFIKFTSESFAQYSYNVTVVDDPETYFQIDEFLDLANRQKPVIYINTSEVFSVHALIEENIDILAPEGEDPLRVILEDLGRAPALKDVTRDKELSLTLSNRFADLADDESEVKQLFVETKRYILYIIRIQSGRNLLEILEKPVTARELAKYSDIISKEKAKNTIAKGSLNLESIDFAQLKLATLENLTVLEEFGKVDSTDGYQAVLNSIATDIRNKHRRRVQRRQELRRIRQTLLNLADKTNYLEEQKQTYLDYINACMTQITQKKGKKARVFPFTRQYFHIKDLQRSGKVPKFGSYKYTAERLHQKGVLLEVRQFSPKQYDKISIIISSDEAGVFQVVVSFMGARVEESEVRLDELLQYQFNNVNVISLFDDNVKVNVNLLIFLVNKKFYV